MPPSLSPIYTSWKVITESKRLKATHAEQNKPRPFPHWKMCRICSLQSAVICAAHASSCCLHLLTCWDSTHRYLCKWKEMCWPSKVRPDLELGIWSQKIKHSFLSEIEFSTKFLWESYDRNGLKILKSMKVRRMLRLFNSSSPVHLCCKLKWNLSVLFSRLNLSPNLSV